MIRQSYGICKIYCFNIPEIKFQEIFIYLVNLVFCLIGFFRFYLPILNYENIFILNVIKLLILLIILIVYLLKFDFSENFFTFATGFIIFYLICFVQNPVHVIIMAVTMHYSQYLFITHHVVKERNKDQKIKQNFFLSFIFIVFFYSALMVLLSLLGNRIIISANLIIIQIIGQMLYFYLDS